MPYVHAYASSADADGITDFYAQLPPRPVTVADSAAGSRYPPQSAAGGPVTRRISSRPLPLRRLMRVALFHSKNDAQAYFFLLGTSGTCFS